MKQNYRRITIKNIEVKENFWKEKIELIRNKVLPYQWRALNDQIEEAAPSYCIRNMKTAALAQRLRHEGVVLPTRSTKEFTSLPEGNAILPSTEELTEDDIRFYGFVFQDSDLYKWIEAASYVLAYRWDDELKKRIDGMVELIASVMMDDGYMDTFYIINDPASRFTNLRDHHELYCFGHMAEAAAAYYEVTGEKNLLKLAERFAECISTNIGPEPGKKHGYPGHELAEMALMRMYECTGNKKYLELAGYFVDERGRKPLYFNEEHNEPDGDLRYYQSHKPVREQTEAVGHAVRAMYFYSGVTDVARAHADSGLWDAAGRLWNDVTRRKMYITGAVGGTCIGEAFSYAYDLPSDSAYAETCASIGLVFWAERMLMVEQDRRYADVMERALYNSVLSGMSLDGTEFFYVNPLSVNPAACRQDGRLTHVKPRRQKWFGCACCPPNLARMISSVMSYAYGTDGDNLWIHLYMGSTFDTELMGADGSLKKVRVDIGADFPWRGDGTIRLEAESPLKCRIALRVPGWGRNYSIKASADGESIQEFDNTQEKILNQGYLYIEINGQRSVDIEFNYVMEPVFYRSNRKVRECVGQVCLLRGPLVYCLEEADNGSNLHNILVSPQQALKTVQETELDFLGKGSVGIIMDGMRECDGKEALYEIAESATAVENTRLKFIPYYAWANRQEGEMTVWIREK